ncbi:MAG: fatty acid desaturase [Planctomycetales bacterium]
MSTQDASSSAPSESQPEPNASVAPNEELEVSASETPSEESGNAGSETSVGKSKRIPRPSTISSRILWPYVVAFVGFHLLFPLAFVPYLFSWTGVALVFIGNYVFCSTGIGLCFHRTLTHRGLVLPKWLERTFAVFGVCSLMDSPARWVAIHRMHHQFSDQQEDPHSPLAGFFWGHVGWLLRENTNLSHINMYEKYARDVLRDPFYLWMERYYRWAWIYFAHAVLFFLAGLGIGWATGGTAEAGLQCGLRLLMWGVVVRTIYTWHITWAVNSVSHVWGYRNHETSDDSRNNWLVALATNGEGWHNNHHAKPTSAAYGHRWWELDVTYMTIRVLEFLGLATDVKDLRDSH